MLGGDVKSGPCTTPTLPDCQGEGEREKTTLRQAQPRSEACIWNIEAKSTRKQCVETIGGQGSPSQTLSSNSPNGGKATWFKERKELNPQKALIRRKGKLARPKASMAAKVCLRGRSNQPLLL